MCQGQADGVVLRLRPGLEVVYCGSDSGSDSGSDDLHVDMMICASFRLVPRNE
jgi:hypothetical protein